MESTVVINGLTIGYGKKVVANNINASIQKGELTCLLGANGVGKSTLLKTLSGFLGKLDGNISIMGKEMDTYSPKELSTTLGVVLTDKCEVRNMSVREIVGMGRSPYTSFWGALSKEDYKIVDQAIEMIGITHLSGRMVHTLSDGERQKAMIAKSLAQQTPIIILDEPTAFLDFPSKVEIMQLLHKLTREAGKTIFLSTHDMELALQIADKIWIMDKTCGFAIGTPENFNAPFSMVRFWLAAFDVPNFQLPKSPSSKVS
jgi:iron complex transport system ATP-binding protein